MSQDSNRTKIWFPLFSYFESSVDGIVPNEYNSILDIVKKMTGWIIVLKDMIMLNARRFWDPLRKKDELLDRNEYPRNLKPQSSKFGKYSGEISQKSHNGSVRPSKTARRKQETTSTS